MWSYDGIDLVASWATNNGPSQIATLSVGDPAVLATYSGLTIYGLAVGSDDTIYAVDTEAYQIIALDSELRPLWSRTINPITQPALDCARNDAGVPISGRPGSLYVGLYQGMLAMIVDSHGLSTKSSWPKHQHDPRNTGNTATVYACP